MRVRRSRIGSDVFDLKELQSVQNSLAKLSGLSIVIFDSDGNPVVTEQSPPYVRFCEEVVKSTLNGSQACHDCDEQAMACALEMVQNGGVPKLYQCHAGLWDFVAPILIDNTLFGYLWCGRVRAEEDCDLEIREHHDKARKYCISPEEYITALRNVPVLPKERIEASARILYQVAMAIASQTYQRTQELTILHKTASLIVRTGNPRLVLHRVLEEAQKAINADCLCLYRYDRRRDRFDEPIAIGLLDEEAMQGPTTETSVVWQVLAAKGPRFEEDAQKAFEAGSFAKRERIASCVAFPLSVQRRPVGVLFINFRAKQKFSGARRHTLVALANQVALAIDYHRVVEELRAKFDQSAKEFQMLVHAGAAVSFPLGLNEVLDHLLQEGLRLVRANRGCVRIVNQDETLVVPHYWWPRGLGQPRHLSFEKAQGISGHVWKTGKPYRTSDVSKDLHYYHTFDDVISELAVPIVTQDRVIGVLNVSSTEKHAFQESDQRLLAALANLAAVAIEKSNLLVALREVAEATVGEPSDFFRLLIAKACGLVRVVCAPSVWLFDEPNNCIYHVAIEKNDPFAGCGPLPLEGSISGKVITTSKPIAIKDIFAEQLYCYKDIAKNADLKSLLSVPILAGGEPVGVFNVHTSTVHKFKDWEIDILSAFAAQAGAAIQINKNLTRLRRLHSYAESLSSARDFSQVTERVVEHTREAIRADVTCLWLYDSLTQKFYYGDSIGLEEKEIEHALPRPDGMSEEILITRAPIVIADTKKESEESPGRVNPHAIEFGIRAIGGFPLLVGTRAAGVLYVDFRHPYYYTSDQIETLEAMARLAAVTIDSARAVEAMQQFLITVTHDLKAPLSAIDVQIQMLNLFGYDLEGVRKIHGETRRLTQLVENLLGLLRAEHAAKPLLPEQVDLMEMLDSVEDMWSALIQKHGLTVKVTVAPDAKVVPSDKERVQCIFFNLLDNAVKFAKRGGHVCVEVTRDHTSFVIVVKDDGPGMSANQVERFRLGLGQAPGPYWEEMRSGVGYAAVRRFTADIGGEVDIQSSRAGTKVIVRLPFLRSEQSTRRACS